MNDETRKAILAELSEMVGQRLPGGCQDCVAAFHEYVEESPGVFHVYVEHEETCPQLRARQSP